VNETAGAAKLTFYDARLPTTIINNCVPKQSRARDNGKVQNDRESILLSRFSSARRNETQTTTNVHDDAIIYYSTETAIGYLPKYIGHFDVTTLYSF
jgi:hypothetical protein